MLYPDYADRNGGRDYSHCRPWGPGALLEGYPGGRSNARHGRRSVGRHACARADDLPRRVRALLLAVGRNTIFNHQFNIVASAYDCARVLNDFKAGERLEQEVKRHFDLLMTAGLRVMDR